MGRKSKIDLEKLEHLITEENKSLTEIAAYFGVSVPAVSKARKKLGIAIVRNAAISRAPAIVQKKMTAIEQLDYLWNCTDEILVACMNWLRSDDDPETALRILESQVKYISFGKDKKKMAIKEYKFRDPRDLALKAIGQAIGVNREKRELLKTLYDVTAVREFMNEIIQLLAETSPELRNTFIQKVKEKKALNSALEIHGS